MQTPSKDETIDSLRQRHREAMEHLQRARKDGDKAQMRAWATAFKRISTLSFEAGDDMNAPIL